MCSGGRAPLRGGDGGCGGTQHRQFVRTTEGPELRSFWVRGGQCGWKVECAIVGCWELDRACVGVVYGWIAGSCKGEVASVQFGGSLG